MALPFLPGNSFNPNLGKNKYHKSHHFDYSNSVAMNVGEEKPGIGGDILPGQKMRPKNSAIPRGEGRDQPAWVAFDKQVLSFDAYFQEAVHEKREEQYRVRNCKVYFYLEDDSIQVIEPRLKNSGVPQGTLVRRHRVPRPPPNDDQFYTVEDFNVGSELCLYGKVFKLLDCDEFTTNFLKKLGVRVGQPVQLPADPYMGHRKALDESMQPLRPYEKHDTLRQFLDHDGHVLRFFCFWDDTDNMFGDPREMVFHYFLSDDTIEIREKINPNSGRDAAPLFLNRGRLPKSVDPVPQPGTKTDRTVLNVFGPMGQGGRYILDSLKTGAVNQQYYTDADLSVGAVVNVWGRKFVLCDADDFTKEYYKTKYGISNIDPVPFKQSGKAGMSRQNPPYNGFGSEEDSLCNCINLIPKPPKRDFIKFMQKDRHGLDSNVLRFMGRMDTTKPIDQDRRFIISYFLSDDTALVFEPPVRNSGIIGGKFLERGRVKKPSQEPFSTEMSTYYNATDFYVGATVVFNNFKFILIDCDEYAFNYMENHSDIGNINAILQKLHSLAASRKEDFMRDEVQAGGPVTYERFRQLLAEMAEAQLTEHEMMTVARYYQDQKEDEALAVGTMLSLAQEQLRKKSFEDFTKLVEQCMHHDSPRSGFLHPDSVRTAFRALHSPLNDDLLRGLIAKMPQNEAGQVSYRELIDALNWRMNPMAPPTQNKQSEDGWQGNQASRQLQNVNQAQFLQDLFGKA